jgi:hypothetical protein
MLLMWRTRYVKQNLVKREALSFLVDKENGHGNDNTGGSDHREFNFYHNHFGGGAYRHCRVDIFRRPRTGHHAWCN